MELVRGIEQLVNKAKENTKAYVRSEEEEKKEKAKAAVVPASAGERKKKMEELKKEYLGKVDLLKELNYPVETERAFVQAYARLVGARYAALFKQGKADYAERITEARKGIQDAEGIVRMREDSLNAAWRLLEKAEKELEGLNEKLKGAQVLVDEAVAIRRGVLKEQGDMQRAFRAKHSVGIWMNSKVDDKGVWSFSLKWGSSFMTKVEFFFCKGAVKRLACGLTKLEAEVRRRTVRVKETERERDKRVDAVVLKKKEIESWKSKVKFYGDVYAGAQKDLRGWEEHLVSLKQGNYWENAKECTPEFARAHGLALSREELVDIMEGLGKAREKVKLVDKTTAFWLVFFLREAKCEKDVYLGKVSEEELLREMASYRAAAYKAFKDEAEGIKKKFDAMAEEEKREEEKQKRHIEWIGEQYDQRREKWKGAYYDSLTEMRDLGEQNPLLLPCSSWTGRMVKRQREAARKSVVAPWLNMGYRREGGMLDGEGSDRGTWGLPVLTPWQGTENGRGNFLVEYGAGEEAEALRFMNHLLLNMVLSFPAKKLRLAFADLNMTNAASFFTVNFDSRLCHGGAFTTEEKFRRYLETLQEGIQTNVFKRCDNVVKYNVEHGTVLAPYEVIVLLDFPEAYSPGVLKLLRPLFANGHKAGVYFVAMAPQRQGKGWNVEGMDSFVRLPVADLTGFIYGGGGVAYFPLESDEEGLRECLRLVNEEWEAEETAPAITQATEALAGQAFEDAGDGFRVAVGETNGRTQWFQLDEVEHIHSFVLGKSGSGKSVFLHDIIANAILRYSPESLQLFLLDFKLGGVEFNRYRDVKQVKALLVDNSDRQIVLEILRDIYGQMKRRGELMREAGARNLKEYNRLHPERRFARIVLVVDECHELFQDRVDKVQAEINQILTKISKEGRNQGVHFIFATQTLPASGSISPDILKNITDYYLLKSAPADADRLVRDSGRQVAQLATGWLLYSNSGTEEVFQAYFRDKEQLEAEIQTAVRKAGNYPDEGRFFFSGKQLFTLDAADLDAAGKPSEAVALLGRNINVGLKPVGLSLLEEPRENVLVVGTNNRGQGCRVAMNAWVSLMASARRRGLPHAFYVLSGLKRSDEGEAARLLALLEGLGCTVVKRGRWGEFLLSTLRKVRERRAEKQVILLLEQENFRELEWNEEIEAEAAVPEPRREAGRMEHLGGAEVPEFLRGLDAPLPRGGQSPAKRETFRGVLAELLKRGPEQGVHAVVQVDSLSKVLFEEVVTVQGIASLFNYWVMLKSPEEANHKLRLPDEVRLDLLSEERDMLRAYCHDCAEGTYTLFTPYAFPDEEMVKTLLNQ